MKQHTHLFGDVKRITRIIRLASDDINKLGFKLHLIKDASIILEVEKTNIKTIKTLVELIGVSLGFWEIKHFFPKGLKYEISMNNKIIIREESISGV